MKPYHFMLIPVGGDAVTSPARWRTIHEARTAGIAQAATIQARNVEVVVIETKTRLAVANEFVKGSQAADSRFYPGYTWVSDRADCQLGLCMPGAPAEAARLYITKNPRLNTYYNVGRTFTVWTLADAAAQPERHDIIL